MFNSIEPNCFPKWLYILHSIVGVKVSVAPYSAKSWYCLFNFSYLGVCSISLCFLTNVEHLFMYLFAICIFFFSIVFVQTFCPFLIGLLVLLMSCKKAFMYFKYNLLLDIHLQSFSTRLIHDISFSSWCLLKCL